MGIFNEVVGNTLINYNSNGLNASVNCGAGLEETGTIKWVTSFPNDYAEDSCDYLIITHNNFYTDPVAKSEIESLAQHRADFNGFDVVMTKTSSIYTAIPDSITPDMDKKIKIFLQNTYENGNAYHTYDGKLAYINLFGDAFFGSNPLDVCVPTHSEGYDVYFTQVYPDDDDIYPDLMIGRCSVDTVTQVENVVHKILNFKPNDNYWKNNFYSVIGEVSPPSYSSPKKSMDKLHPLIDTDSVFLSYEEGFNYSMPNWINIPYTFQNKTPVLNRLSKGVQHYLYTGHGLPSGTGVLHFSDLDSTHNNKLFYMVLQACLNGSFHSTDDCMTEEFLSSDLNKGAIAAIGASQLVALWGSALYIDLYKSYFTNYSYVTGENLFEAKIASCNANSQHLVNKYNLFGDPALNVKYENTDTILPDLIVKSSDILVNPEYPNCGDTVIKFMGDLLLKKSHKR